MNRLAVVVAALLGSAVVAHGGETDRYRLEKTQDGYVRMDTQSGEMSICREQSAQLVCKLAADERTAFEDEIDRLGAAMNALDARVAALERAPSAKLESALPTDEELEKTMGTVERLLRKFMGIVKDLEPAPQANPSAPADPQKT